MKKLLFAFCLFAATSALAQTPTATATDTPTPTPTATASATATATGTPVPTATPLSALYRQDTQGQKKALELIPTFAKQVTYTNSGQTAQTTSGPYYAFLYLGNPDDPLATLSDISWAPGYLGMSIGHNPASYFGPALGGWISMQNAEWPIIQNREEEANSSGGVILDTSLTTDVRRQKFQDKAGTFAYLSDIPSPTPYPTPSPVATPTPRAGDLTGTVTVAHGGTGDTTLTAHGVLIGAGSTPVVVTGTGSTGQVLTSNGSSADPTFQSAATPTPSAVGARSVLGVVADGVPLSTLTGTLYTCPSDPGLAIGSNIGSEGEVLFVIPFACTLKNLNVRTDTDNAAIGTPTTVITVRKNSADTALSVNMTQTSSTTTTDSTHSVSFSAGDRLTISITTTGLAATSAGIATITMECDQN